MNGEREEKREETEGEGREGVRGAERDREELKVRG